MRNMFASKEKVFSFGFTGSSKPLPELQIETLKKVVKKIARKKEVEHHNGMCINGDEECYKLVTRYMCDAKVVMHPPKNQSKVFEPCKRLNLEFRTPREYLKRNMQIVAESDFLVAAPDGVAEELRSGTWSTIRYARIARIPILIVWPNGSTRFEKPETVEE